MIIKIQDVKVGPEEELIDYTITGQFKNGKNVIIHGKPDQDLSGLIGKEIECLLLVNNLGFESDLNLYGNDTKVYECKYLGFYDFLEDWTNHISKYYVFKNTKFYAIEVKGGYFLGLWKTFRYKNFKFKGNQTYRFWIPSFGLIAWHPIE